MSTLRMEDHTCIYEWLMACNNFANVFILTVLFQGTVCLAAGRQLRFFVKNNGPIFEGVKFSIYNT